jgi:hypothetical protein
VTRFEKVLLNVSVLLATLTGAAHFVMKHLLSPRDPYSVVNHPWQPQMLAAHVLLVPFVVFSLGLIAREHILARFLEGRPRPGRGSGLGTVVVAAPLVASGYLLQVVTGEAARAGLAWSHIATGGLFAVIFALHAAAAARPRNGERTNGNARGGPAAARAPRLD